MADLDVAQQLRVTALQEAVKVAGHWSAGSNVNPGTTAIVMAAEEFLKFLNGASAAGEG